MKKTIVALAMATTLVSTGAYAQQEKETEAGLGLGGGALIGAIAGGPIGAVVGAGLGIWLGDKVGDGRDLPAVQGQLASTGEDLRASQDELKIAKSRIHTLRGALQDRDIRLAKASQRESAPPPALEIARGLQLEVMFRTGKSELTDATRQRLDDLAEMLAALPGFRLRLDGFADPRGDADYNEKLSLARIEAVRAALLSGGIPAARVTGFAHGERQAASSDGDLDGHALERRVSITLVGEADRETVAASTPDESVH